MNANYTTTSPFNRNAGLTLIEVLISFVIISILIGITVVGLRSARERGQMMKCLTHIRSMGDMVQIYASDNRSYFPTWVESVSAYNSTPSRWHEYAYQIFGTFENTRWQEYMSLKSDSSIMYCPANHWYPDWFGEAASPDYILSSSVYISPTYLNPIADYSDYSNSLGARVQRVSSTRYPSSKAAVYEMSVWHGWRGVFEPGLPVGSLSYRQSVQPGSVWFIDGHAEQIFERDATRPMNRYPVWSPMTFGTTPNGILGRDI